MRKCQHLLNKRRGLDDVKIEFKEVEDDFGWINLAPNRGLFCVFPNTVAKHVRNSWTIWGNMEWWLVSWLVG